MCQLLYAVINFFQFDVQWNIFAHLLSMVSVSAKNCTILRYVCTIPALFAHSSVTGYTRCKLYLSRNRKELKRSDWFSKKGITCKDTSGYSKMASREWIEKWTNMKAKEDLLKIVFRPIIFEYILVIGYSILPAKLSLISIVNKIKSDE
jgi:hypothetical protein